MAWKAQGHSVDELPFRAMGGIWGSAFGATVLVLVLIAQVSTVFHNPADPSHSCFFQFYIAVAPIGGTESAGKAVEAFFLSYLAFPVVLAFYIAGFLWKRSGPKKASQIDLVTGRKVWSTAEELNAWVRISLRTVLWDTS